MQFGACHRQTKDLQTTYHSDMKTFKPFAGCLSVASLLLCAFPDRTVLAQTPPPNDMFTNAIVLTGAVASATGSNVSATNEPGEPLGLGGKSVWWTWTAPSNGSVKIDTHGSSFDTVVVVYQGTNISDLRIIAANDDNGSDQAAVCSFSAVEAGTYQICVDGHNPTTNSVNAMCGMIMLRLQQGILPPSIATQPRSFSVLPGMMLGLSCAASPLPLSYQWLKNGTNVPGATKSSYWLGAAVPEHSGTYCVVISNSVGSVTSSDAVVIVRPVVFSSEPESGTSGVALDFKFNSKALSNQGVYYQWFKDGVVLPGATASAYTVTNVQLSDAGLYHVVASNELDCITSTNASLAVVPYTFTTVAGWAAHSGSQDGTGPEARFYEPCGVALDRGGNLYVTEWRNHTIRKVTPQGVVTTVAGLPGATGTNDGPSLDARFFFPEGIVVDANTNIYVSDNANQTIRKISPDGFVTTIAGVPGVAGWQDGPASTALFHAPNALALDADSNLYVAEWYNNSIRKITPEGVVTTVFGVTSQSGFDALTIDAANNLFVSGEYEGPVMYVTPGGLRTSLTNWPLRPYGGALDKAGNYYCAGSIAGYVNGVWRLGLDRRTAVLAGREAGAADGPGGAAKFRARRSGITIDNSGNLYIADNLNHTIRKGMPFLVANPPQDQTLPPGTNVTLSVGNGPFTYQWFFKGVPLEAQTNATLQIAPLDRSNAGVYSVTVTTATAESITFYATVRVLVPPILETPQVLAPKSLRLSFRDADGGLPYDLTGVVLQWRTNLPSGSDTNWGTVSGSFYVTNGFAAIEDTNVLSKTRFYQVLER